MSAQQPFSYARAARLRPAFTSGFQDRKRLARLPTAVEIDAIPVVPVAIFTLNERELKELRVELYRRNKEHTVRFRTLRDGDDVLVWRIQ